MLWQYAFISQPMFYWYFRPLALIVLLASNIRFGAHCISLPSMVIGLGIRARINELSLGIYQILWYTCARKTRWTVAMEDTGVTAEENVPVSKGERPWTGKVTTSGRCLIRIVSTNSKFLIDRRYPLLNRFQGERYFLRDQTFLLSSICPQHNPTLQNGSIPVRASSGYVRTSFSAFLTAFSRQRSRFPGTAIA